MVPSRFLQCSSDQPAGVAILQVDTDRRIGTIDRRSTASSSSTSTTRSRMASSPSRSAAPASRGATSRRTGPPSDRRTRCASSRLRSSAARRACGSSAAASRPGSGSDDCSWSRAAAMTVRSGSRSRRARRGCHCACWRRMAACWRTSARVARIGVAGRPVLVRQRAHRSRRDRRDRGRRPRRGAHRLRVADARRRAQERHAAPRPARGAPWAGARVHPLAGRLVRLDLQVAGRHRPARLARLPPQ